MADGSNVGIDRRGIDSFRRLRVDRACQRLGVPLVNLNLDPGQPVALQAGANPRVASTIQGKGFLISIPKIKTHAEAVLSCAMKNWMGIVAGQDKRQMHYDLCRNIFAINQQVRPDLVIVDGLVGMEGNGPGDGDPFRLGLLMVCDDAFLNDLAVCRLMALSWRDVPYLRYAAEAGIINEDMARQIEASLPVLRPIRHAPARSRLAILSEAPSLMWLKRAVRPLVEKPAVAQAAYRLRIIQDVYDRSDDTLRLVRRQSERCEGCSRCVDICPMGLDLDAIGRADERCIQCLYCWFICPRDALVVEGDANHMARQLDRYGQAMKDL